MTTVDRHPTIRSSHSRPGLTLIEIMIALTMTLIVLGAMMQAFQFASVEMSKGRAIMEAANQLRATETTLRRDLEGLTVDPRPHVNSIPSGYFEIVEGPTRDHTGYSENPALYGYLGDIDDVLALTVRSNDQPFRGRLTDPSSGAVTVIESTIAEVIWWTSFNDRNQNSIIDYDESVSVNRRVLLIRPDLILDEYTDTEEFFRENDISARNEAGGLIANSITDLANRANRFCHDPTMFPYILRNDLLQARRVSEPLPGVSNVGPFTGDDVMLTNVTAFDVKVYSIDAAVNVIAGTNRIREQSDVNFQIDIGGNYKLGGYRDLGALPGLRGTQGDFSNKSSVKSQLRGAGGNSVQVYDTWTSEYEIGGQGADGIDNDGMNGVDDTDERETEPPYPKPIRGLKITLRVIEKNSKQIRQSSLVHSFVPQ